MTNTKNYLGAKVAILLLLSAVLILSLLAQYQPPPVVLRLIEENIDSATTDSPLIVLNSTEAPAPFDDPYANTNRKWVKRIRDYCTMSDNNTIGYSNKQLRKLGLPGWVWMASKNHNLFYCAAPKCSSTTWKTYLMDDIGKPWAGNPHV